MRWVVPGCRPRPGVRGVLPRGSGSVADGESSRCTQPVNEDGDTWSTGGRSDTAGSGIATLPGSCRGGKCPLTPLIGRTRPVNEAVSGSGGHPTEWRKEMGPPGHVGTPARGVSPPGSTGIAVLAWPDLRRLRCIGRGRHTPSPGSRGWLPVCGTPCRMTPTLNPRNYDWP